MKWTSPQTVSALGSLLLGFTLIYLDFFMAENNEVHDSTLWVLGQAFIYAGSIFGIKGYVDGRLGNLNKQK
jgi:hypothetical protein